MRFYLVDRIYDVAQRVRIRAAKLVSSLDPVVQDHPAAGPVLAPTLVIECLAQTSAWLILASTDFAQRGVLAGLRHIEFGQPAPLGARLDLASQAESWSDEAIVFNGEVSCNGQSVIHIEGALCFLIPADRLEDPQVTRHHFEALRQDAESRETDPPPTPSLQPVQQPPALQWVPYDGLEELAPGERARAGKAVAMADPVFDTHFPRLAAVPGVLLMESIVHLARTLLAASGSPGPAWQLKTIRHAKFQRYVRPGDHLALQAQLRDLSPAEARLTGSGTVEGTAAVSLRQMVFVPAEGSVGV